jgi:hypothetical protein
MSDALRDTRLCLTFSSTAAIEAAVRGIPTRIITDLGIHENLGNHFFMGSGMLASFADVRPDMEHVLDRDWRAANVVAAVDRLPDLTARCDALLSRQAQEGRALPPPYPTSFGRSDAYERFLSSSVGWAAVAQFGTRPGKPLRALRRFLGPTDAWVRAGLRAFGRIRR